MNKNLTETVQKPTEIVKNSSKFIEHIISIPINTSFLS